MSVIYLCDPNDPHDLNLIYMRLALVKRYSLLAGERSACDQTPPIQHSSFNSHHLYYKEGIKNHVNSESKDVVRGP